MSLEPFGSVREDLRAAVVASTVARVHGAEVGPEDYFATLGAPRRARAQTLAEAKAVARAIAGLTSGRRRK